MIKFLKLKHWQLFILIIIIPMSFQFIKFGSVISNNNEATMLDNFPIIMIFGIAMYFSWLYSLGINLYKKLSLKGIVNIKAFKFFVFIPVIYLLITSLFLFRIPTNEFLSLGIFTILVPLLLLAVFTHFYCIYFIAKVLKMIESQKQLIFSDFKEEFYLIFIFPVGIWNIQPRINKIFEKHD